MDWGPGAAGEGEQLLEADRVRPLNAEPERAGAYVLYWMQQSQRASGNPALELAIDAANRLGLPVVVGFGLTERYPDANARHFAFLLQGLADTALRLTARGIGFVVRRGSPERVALALARDAALVVCDRGYLRHQQAWRDAVAADAGRRVLQVEGDVVVPVARVSGKEEYAARTLRPKLLRHRDDYVVDPVETAVERRNDGAVPDGDVNPADPAATLAMLDVDRSVEPVKRFIGGTAEARRRLRAFLDGGLAGYADGRNEPADWQGSFLSPYLHFGQISPVEVARAAATADVGSREDRAAFLEELIVRRELAANYVTFQPAYDRFDGLSAWARKTLAEHAGDRRDRVYSPAELAAADTHDRYWNAAMREMVHTGFMQNYMRMYWGKKILEWSPSPQTAFATTLALNNRYFLDGRDPNSYANVGWIFGLHDRAWTERPIFGKIRYMNDKGLERKFDMDRYIRAVDHLVAAERD